MSLSKTAVMIARHLAHSKPVRPEPRLSTIRELDVVQAKENQWEVDCLMVMDGLASAVTPSNPFSRGEFLLRIDKQFEEDERDRSEGPPVGAEEDEA